MDDLTTLAIAAQGGDDGALRALIRGTQADVWRLAAQMVGRHHADDVTQETFVRAWQALPRYRATASVRTWLLAIARNTAIDAIRAERRRPGTRNEADAVADATDIVGTVALFEGLEHDRRIALYLTQILGLSYAEAAVVVDVPVGTIRSRVARARADLMRALDDESPAAQQ